MSTGMRWALIICAAVFVSAAISIVGTMVFVVGQPRHSVPLTAELTGSWDAISNEFDRRVRTRFPLGSSEADMTREIRSEGFTRDDWSFVNPQGLEAKAMRREDRVVCRQAAYIFWRANREGRLISIRGVYRVEGCL